MTDDAKRVAPSAANGGAVHFRHRNALALDRHQELVLFTDLTREHGVVSIEGGPQEAAIAMTSEDMLKMAGALIDAADAIENAARKARQARAARR